MRIVAGFADFFSMSRILFFKKFSSLGNKIVERFKMNHREKIVKWWLITSSGLVCGIVILGGYTRLTNSGLSMIDWSLMHFRIPRSDNEWETYFLKYKKYPEFSENVEMSLDEFKKKYWIEHAHRVYGRLLGLYITIPSALFLMLKWLDKPMKRRIYLINASVILQVMADNIV